MSAEAVKIPLSRVRSQKTLAIDLIKEIGCQTPDCANTPTHVALVEVTLDTGDSFTSVQHLCSLCALARSTRSLPKA